MKALSFLKPTTRSEALAPDALEAGFPFGAVAFFVIFTFLNLPYRIEVLGLLRPTVIATVLFTILVIANGENMKGRFDTSSARWLAWLIAWIILTLPFVKYPGSILHKNLEGFAKWAIFFPLMVAFVDSETRLRQLVYIFVGCTVFRCLDPLYLHLHEGYWGSVAHWDDSGRFMERLSGARWDVVNPNGLAEICAAAIAFLHPWAMCRGASWKRKAVYFTLGPAIVWTLILTASRSGLIALLLVAVLIIWFSKRRALGMGILLLSGIVVMAHLSGIQKDRFESIYDSHTKNASTAEGRIKGIEENLELFMQRPVFGYGLGTSLEASFNYQDGTHMAHDIYTQTLIELGLGGFIILMGYMGSVCLVCYRMFKMRRNPRGPPLPDGHILLWLPRALFLWTAMNVVFDVASYGLSSYEWYLLGGLTMVSYRLLKARETMTAAEEGSCVRPEEACASGTKIERMHSRRPILLEPAA